MLSDLGLGLYKLLSFVADRHKLHEKFDFSITRHWLNRHALLPIYLLSVKFLLHYYNKFYPTI